MKMNLLKPFLKGIPADLPLDESARNDLASRAIAYKSPVGCIGMVAADQNSISYVFFTDNFPFDEPPHLQIQYPVLSRAQELLDRYFTGESLDVSDIPIQVDWGTPFQRKVWDAIQRIPYGELCSYKWIAEQIGKPKAVRAVGGAVGANPVSILRPCHRVVRSSGALGGYGGGLERKQQLLALEGHTIEELKTGVLNGISKKFR